MTGKIAADYPRLIEIMARLVPALRAGTPPFSNLDKRLPQRYLVPEDIRRSDLAHALQHFYKALD